MIETYYNVPGSPHLALLGDFHNGEMEPIVSSLRKNRPSLICIAGDLVYARVPEEGLIVDAQSNVLPFLNSCVSIAPTFLSLGNHESVLTTADWKAIADTGVEILDNCWKQWNGIWIGGLTSHYVLERRATTPMDQYPDRNQKRRENPIKTPDTSWLTPLPPGFTLLLSHQPEYYPMLPKEIGCVLSAHAHGGQIRLFNHGLYAPGQGWWPQWTRGIYGHMIVTAGLTNTANVPRLNNPTEIIYIN